MTHPPAHPRRGRVAGHPAAHACAAFTLMELVVVMAIIGIMAVIAAPRYSSSISRYRLNAATQRVIADLKAARRQAGITSTATVFTITQASSTYTVSGMGRFDNRSGMYTVNLAADPYFAAVTDVTLDSGSTVTATPYGELTGTGTITIKVGSFSNKVELDAASGEYTIK